MLYNNNKVLHDKLSHPCRGRSKTRICSSAGPELTKSPVLVTMRTTGLWTFSFDLHGTGRPNKVVFSTSSLDRERSPVI